MTYAVSSALQKAVFGVLHGDAALTGLVGGAVFDSAPQGAVPDLYIAIGEEKVRDRSDQTGGGALHSLVINVVSSGSAFLPAKEAAGAACDALLASSLTLDRGRIVFLNFERAEARRVRSGIGREIILRFTARVEDN